MNGAATLSNPMPRVLLLLFVLGWLDLAGADLQGFKPSRPASSPEAFATSKKVMQHQIIAHRRKPKI
jgi:hypothetical protein